MTVYLHGLSTALPPHCLTQTDVRERASIIFGGKYPQFDRLSKTFDTAGIDKRYSVVPIDWFSEDHGWADRNAAFMTGAKAMFIDAAQLALTNAGWTSSDVDCVVTVCSTGIATPTLDAQVFSEMGFREDIMRVPIFGLGCAGGVSGLSVAQTIAAAKPNAKVLLVVVETCSLSFRADRLQKADIIAAVLFGDGSAAACTDIPQVACRLMAKLPNFADRSRVFRSKRRLRSPERRMWVDWAAKPHHPRPAATFFSAAGRPVLPLSFSLVLDRGHAHNGGARRRWIAVRIARTIGPVTATSASWKVMARA